MVAPDVLTDWLLETHETMGTKERSHTLIDAAAIAKANFAANITALLEKLDWTQVRMAEEIGTTKETINRWKKNGHPKNRDSAPLKALVAKFRIVKDSLWETKIRYLSKKTAGTEEQLDALKQTSRWPRIADLIQQEYDDEIGSARS